MPPAKHFMRSAVCRHSGSEAGQSLAEFALILFVLVMIILGIVDFSRAIYARSVIANAAREGARYAVIHPSDTAGIKKAAAALAVGLDNQNSFQVQVSGPISSSIAVSVTYVFRPISMLIATYAEDSPGKGFTMLARSTMRVE